MVYVEKYLGGIILIEVKNLTKKYGDRVAVNDISFKADGGRIYGFLGPNGAGKSTTMNIITGCLAATEGQVLINGNDIYENPKKAKKCIGYLPEIPPVYPDMTPFEYLMFVGEAKGVKGDKLYEQVEWAIEKTGLGKMRSRTIKTLSKGYRQRVGIAQAIIGDPDIIILDEPMVGLDPKQIIEMRALIRELGENHTVFLSSHILSEISEICDHLLIISGGKIVAQGTIEELNTLINGNHTSLTVKGDLRTIEKVIESIKEINEYRTDVKKDGTVNLEISSEKDIRELLFNRFAEIKFPILYMSGSEKNLETIFLTYTDPNAEFKEEFPAEELFEEKEEAEAYTPLFSDKDETKGDDRK